jgi:imidazolonepropionase-like amidohydrolase
MAFTCVAQPGTPHTIAIAHVNIVDVVAGNIRADQTVIVTDNRIAAAGAATATKIPAGVTSIPGQGKYLLPGLWDMHVHLRSDREKPDLPLSRENESILDLFLPNGVVGIRDMGGDLSDQVIQWRNEIRAGKREGPYILTAGRKLDNDPPIWPGSIGVASPDEARQAVRQVSDTGADFVKVYFRDVAPAIFKAVIEEAHSRRLKVTGHKPDSMSIQEFVETGVDGMEHALTLPVTLREQYDELQHERSRRSGKPWAMNGRERLARLTAMDDDKEGDRVYRRMAEKQLWVTPTIAVETHTGFLEDGGRDHDSDDRKLFIFPAIWATWDPTTSVRKPPSSELRPLLEAVSKHNQRATVTAFKAGVPMILGTDCGANNTYMIPGWSTHEELQALVRIGLTPADALRLATLNAAKWRGASDEGSVEQGKVADLVLLRSNPLSDIRHTQEVDSVFQGGHYYSRSDLDSMLKRAHEHATQAAQAAGSPR